MQFRNIMLAMGFAALVLGTEKDGSKKDEAIYGGHGSAVTTTKGESKNAWYYGGQKDQGQSAKTTGHENKVTKTKGHSDVHTTHVDIAGSKETDSKGKGDGKGGSKSHKDSGSSEYNHDSKGDKDSGNSEEYKDSKDYKDSKSSEGSYDSKNYDVSEKSGYSYHGSSDYSNKDYTSTVSIGPEETDVKGSYEKGYSTVSIGPEETELGGSYEKGSSTSVSIGPEETQLSTTKIMIHATHTSQAEYNYKSDKTTTKTNIKTLFETHNIESATAKIYYTTPLAQSAPPQITIDTSAAPAAIYTTPATYVANVPNTLATVQSTPAAILASSAFVGNATASAPPKFTGGSVRVGGNLVVVMALSLGVLGVVGL